ncbi:MAG: hypothetical protein WBA17_18425, partial [Saprospiraceae bacterium]
DAAAARGALSPLRPGLIADKCRSFRAKTLTDFGIANHSGLLQKKLQFKERAGLYQRTKLRGACDDHRR